MIFFRDISEIVTVLLQDSKGIDVGQTLVDAKMAKLKIWIKVFFIFVNQNKLDEKTLLLK